MSNDLRTEKLLDLTKTIASELFDGVEYPWEALPGITEFILRLGPSLPEEEYIRKGDDIWIHKTAVVAPTAWLHGPLIICENAEIRHCAFIRGSAIIGRGSVVGNSTELKNCIIFDSAQVPHYNYIGDSILGYKAHLGAGAVTSNLKSDRSLVTISMDDAKLPTGLKKFGAIIGDNVEIGCSSVLNPGSVICRNSTIYPLSMVRGVVPENSIYKCQSDIVTKILS